MKLENQVCTLAQAKQLKELGLNQASCLTWKFDNVNQRWELSPLSVEEHELLVKSNRKSIPDTSITEVYSAFTVAEMGVVLGAELGRQFYRSYSKKYNWEGSEAASFIQFDTQAESYGNQVIKGLQAGVFTVDTANERLQNA